ncbi:hypothetical protein ACFY04_21715 [Streptomyces sp. NPDC001549]|uniref:hypothetical protein n=1 Tax=Streptomyces sp. NPDC001549 TaxID=3364586 RepID=UPI003696A23D
MAFMIAPNTGPRPGIPKRRPTALPAPVRTASGGVALLGLIAMAEPYKFVIMNRLIILLMSRACA